MLDRQKFKELQAESKIVASYPQLMLGNSDIQNSASSSLPDAPDKLKTVKSEPVATKKRKSPPPSRN